MHYFKGAREHRLPMCGLNKVQTSRAKIICAWHVTAMILSVCVYISIHVCFYKPDYLYMRIYASIGMSIRTGIYTKTKF